VTRFMTFWLLTAALLTALPSARAQQPAKIPRIGFMSVGSQALIGARIEAFKQGLRERGYVEGKNIAIEWRFAEGKFERQNEFAAEFVRLQVDAIVTTGARDTRAAKRATNKIPIIMGQDSDPVANGFIASLAHPGGNITGLSTLAPELSGKRMELLKEVVPQLTRVIVLGSASEPGYVETLKEVEQAAKALHVQVRIVEVTATKDIEAAFKQIDNERAGAILQLNGGVFSAGRKQLVSLAAKSRLPMMHTQSEYVDASGLMCYGVNFADLFRRAATYVDKILKGTKPADLPVEQPIKFEFVVNLKTAKQIGLTIPPNVLVRADRVIR